MKAVNLLPRDIQRSGIKPTGPLLTGVIGSVLVTGVLCVGFLMQSAKVAEKRNELDAARAELALVPPPAPPQAASLADGLAGEESARVAALQGALSGRVAWDRLLREVSLVLPKDVWLSSLILNTPVAGATLGSDFQISGTAYSHEGVARLLSRIALIPDLTNVVLINSTKGAGKNSTVGWRITAAIRQPGATS
jgi:Tfp pilus assembly protein PilN